MASYKSLLFACLLATATAAPACKAPVYTLPSTGTGLDLEAPATGLRVLKIGLGHGLQNYTCSDGLATVSATGALAVLYDVTSLYPGTPRTGLSAEAWASLSDTVLRKQDIPLNLQNASAASPNVKMAQSSYAAVVDDPFPAPSALSLPGVLSTNPAFLGHHYFDAFGTPTFDLVSTCGLYASLSKVGSVSAPSTADAGILGTGAVPWLKLAATNGLSQGVQLVYRVITAGGTSEACSTMNAEAGSVPYTAFYWFYG